MKELEELENKHKELVDAQEELGKEIEALKTQKKGRWKPVHCDTYYMVDSTGTVCNQKWYNDSLDSWRYSQGICFKTEKEAEQHKRRLEIEAVFRERSRAFKFGGCNYEINYAHYEKRLGVFDVKYLQVLNTYYFDKEVAEQIIKEFGDELKLLLK